MGVSPLARYWYPVHHFTSGRPYGITHFTFHHMAGNLSLKRCADVLNAREVSATYGIDTEGNIAAYLDEGVCPWSDGNWASNQTTISVEMANDGGADWHVADATLEAAVSLCADVLTRYGLPADSSTIRYHQQYSATACPGPYVIGKWGEVISRVQAKMGASATPTPPQTTETTYTVVKGDTLSSIASRYNTTYQAIAALNNLSNPNLIWPGQVLRIPTSGGSAPSAPTPPAQSPQKSLTELAKEVIAGKWGNGDVRRKRLESAGYDYSAVQGEVNRLLGQGGTTSTGKSIDTLAREVIRGEWGNDPERTRRLKAAGYDAAAVQKRVNQLL